SLATAIFGDLTPAISTALVELTGDKSPPGWWLMCAALCGFSLATAIFGDLTPAISTALVELTGDKSPPGWWLM
ncbi:hypothetical protein CKQ90_35700, partial [Klebsiella pneumoniae]